MSEKNKIVSYGIVIAAIMFVAAIITKTSIESTEREAWLSGMLFNLERLSEDIEDYCELVDSKEMEEALFMLGQIRAGSRQIATSYKPGNGELTREEKVVSNVVSEIWARANPEAFEEDIEGELEDIATELHRINEVLDKVALIGENDAGRFALLANTLERELDLMYPVE